MGVSRIPTWTFIIISTVGRLFGTMMLSITGDVPQWTIYFLTVIVTAGIVFLSWLITITIKSRNSKKKKIEEISI